MHHINMNCNTKTAVEIEGRVEDDNVSGCDIDIPSKNKTPPKATFERGESMDSNDETTEVLTNEEFQSLLGSEQRRNSFVLRKNVTKHERESSFRFCHFDCLDIWD
mmetsp:Transcript_40276/g.84585  ORF Transcript_40276/g.84585 Transcript_40276/m.84585 type:complete len:106 (-) Transcript_40276:481-798(-)